VAVTTSSPERGDQLRKLGPTAVLDRSGKDGSSVASGFDIIIDIVGGEHMPDFFDRLAPNGRMVLVGAVAGFPPEDFGMRLVQAFQQSLSFSTFSLNTVPVAARDAVRAHLFESAARGELRAVVHATRPLEEAADAHRQMDLGTVFGRIVLTP
jgi:NADPH2:quinone reductase